MNVAMELSKPTTGNFFAAGERIVVTITLKDKLGDNLTKNDFATLGLYMFGPQDPTKTVSAVKLLNATTDRSKTPHHYIDLLGEPSVQVTGNVLKYTLQAITNEEAGTYTASLRAIKKGDPPINQAFVLVNFQLKTATVEKELVEKENCAPCHLGASNGQFYLHHVDQVTPANPLGNFSIDSIPVRTCKSCHNNEGYAAYPSPVDGQRIPDPIIFRVHGLHNGEDLKNPLNTDPKNGIFKNYTEVIFPANVENCVVCHTDDRWKTKPSRLACGACHDNTWFGDAASMPKTATAHKGGPQANDAACGACHGPDTGLAPVSVKHKVSQPMNKIDVALTAPANGKFYVAGEKPVVTLTIRDDNNNPIDHTKMSETTFSTALFLVYGPRERAVPVLTNAAKNGDSKVRASLSSSIPAAGTPRVWTFADGDTFKIAVNGGPVQVLDAPAGAKTPEQVAEWLKPNLKDGTVTFSNAAGTVTLLSNVIAAPTSRFEISNSLVNTKMVWKPVGLNIVREGKVVGKTGVTMEPFVAMASVSIPGNDLRPRSDPLNYTDPLVVRGSDRITYQLDDVASVSPGTYMVYAYTVPNGVLAGTGKGPTGAPNAAAKALNSSRTAIGFTTFQVGTETPEKKIATNCADCHKDTIWHLNAGPIHAEPFDTDYCLACHDYQRFSGTGEGFARVGGTSTSGWAGYGAKPISARVHNVHFGRYLEHAEEIYANNPNEFAGIIFPQDVRNCTKCHSDKTTGTWKTEPSRLACLACHDSDSAKAHGALMTRFTTSDPYGPGAIESCKSCHGAGKEFSPDKVHNIAKPYKPPYPREPER